ncbi:MAG: DNA primase [Chthoniobacterales bacterium]
MGRITPESIEQIAAANDIVDVINGYFPLKRAGTSWKALCPFHKEKSPSFTVNPLRQNYHCFGCGAHGTVIGFVMQYENLDYPSAIRRLAQRSGTPIMEEAGSYAESDQRGEEKKRLLALHNEATEWLHQNLMKKPSAQTAREYLKSRGITREVAVRWKLGYAADSWNELLTYLIDRGFQPEEIEKAGLAVRKENSQDLYDRFRDRLMFPISNEMGEVIAFSGRVLDPEAKTAKYVNSPETPLFSKGRVLFGLDKTKRPIIEKHTAIVCEGQLDLITCYEAGVQNVIAPQGTAFTDQQARVLRRFAETVVLCFDADTAGMAAVERSLPALFSVGLEVRVVVMPKGEDPDSTIRKQGVEAFQKLIEGARDFFDHAIQQAFEADTDMSPRSRAAIGKRLASFLGQMDDIALRDAHVQSLSSRLQLSPTVLIDLINSTRRNRAEKQEDHEEAQPQRETIELSSGETILLRAALSSEEVRQWMKELDLSQISHSAGVQNLYEKLRGADFPDDDPQAFSRFLASLPPENLEVINGVTFLTDRSRALLMAKDCWNGMLAERYKARLEHCRQQFKKPGLTTEEITEIQKETLDLTRRLKDIPRFSRWASAS